MPELSLPHLINFVKRQIVSVFTFVAQVKRNWFGLPIAGVFIMFWDLQRCPFNEMLDNCFILLMYFLCCVLIFYPGLFFRLCWSWRIPRGSSLLSPVIRLSDLILFVGEMSAFFGTLRLKIRILTCMILSEVGYNRFRGLIYYPYCATGCVRCNFLSKLLVIN